MAGGMHLLGVREDAIVADIGGTTTDIAVCLDGQAAIQGHGAKVGDFQTHVVAIDIRTVGLGGDSYVQLGQKGELTIGPGRVVPLGYLGDVYGSVVERLAELLDRPADSVLYSQADFFLLLKDAADGQVSQEEMRIVEALRDGPLDRQTISQRVGCTHPSLFVTRELEARGFVIRCSLTPTDALIAEGKLALWSRRASQLAMGLLARQAGVQTAELAERVMEEVYVLLGREIALQACTVDGLDIDNAFLDNMLRKNTKNRVVVPQLKIGMPVVLVGAPADSYCEGVRRVLGTLVETVEHGEVANAVGSVVGSVVVRLIGEITIDLGGRYWVHIIDERFEFEGLAEAKGFAQGRLETLAADGLTDAGGTDGTVTVEMEDHYGLIAGTIAAERVYLRTELHARAVGKPAIS